MTVLAGGFGGAKASHGLALASADRAAAGGEPVELSIVVNVGDDLEVHGLAVSPDLDTVMYTLAGWANDATGWGVRDETWSAAEMLGHYGAPTWFGLGDRDLATHVVRTAALRDGARLTDVTARLAAALGVPARLLPATDDRMRTQVRTADGWLEFQDYFVRRQHADDVLELRFEGAASARPTPEVLAAIARADLIVLAPSNPYVSIGTVLAVPGVADALRAAPAPIVGVSPIVGGEALRGPADRMLETLGGGPASATAVIRHYTTAWPGLLDGFVIDVLDADQADAVAATGVAVQVTDTVMTDHAARQRLAEATLERWLPV